MKLKSLYEKIYGKVFSVPFFARILQKIPALEKLLRYEVVSYLVFGGLTTLVNFLVFYLANLPFGETYENVILFTVGALPVKWIYVSQTLAWLLSALFAFVTNKLLVFESATRKAGAVLRELLAFLGARVISLLLFELLLFGLLEHLLRNVPFAVWLAKVLVAVFVIVFNFAASKLVIFRKKKEENKPPC